MLLVLLVKFINKLLHKFMKQVIDAFFKAKCFTFLFLS